MMRPRFSGVPIFTRVLAVMLACIAAVQATNFALLFVIGPPPPPRVYAASQIAAALGAGVDGAGLFRISIEDDARQSDGMLPGSLSNVLARQLNLAPERVRLEMLGLPEGPGPTAPPGHRPSSSPVFDLADSVLAGDFIAAMRRADGRWTTIRPAETRMGAWQQRTILSLMAALAAAIPFAWFLARRVSAPIGLFAAAANRIGRDPRAPPLAIEGPVEIAEAATAFNEMQRRLNAYVEDRTMMIGAIAHDLRTPLMRMSLRLESAPEAVRSGCERNLDEMQAMIRAATDYVRDVTQVGPRRRLDLRSIAESVVDDYADRGHPVTLAQGEHLVIEGDALTLKAGLENLVGNAIRYAGDAEVTIRQDGDQAVIEVRDHGPGIADDDLPRVFEPFFRGERSRNRDTGGIGLGLASVRGMARAHGGNVELSNHDEGGVLARIILPI